MTDLRGATLHYKQTASYLNLLPVSSSFSIMCKRARNQCSIIFTLSLATDIYIIFCLCFYSPESLIHNLLRSRQRWLIFNQLASQEICFPQRFEQFTTNGNFLSCTSLCICYCLYLLRIQFRKQLCDKTIMSANIFFLMCCISSDIFYLLRLLPLGMSRVYHVLQRPAMARDNASKFKIW